VYYSSSYAQSGSYSLRFYTYTSSAYDDQYAVLPTLDTDVYPLNTLQLTFDAKRYSTSYPFCIVVGAMTGMDVNTFQPIDTMLLNTGGTNYEPQVMFLTGFTGTGDRLALMAPKNIGQYVSGAYYNQGHIDNIVLSVAPTCPQPTHITVDNVTENSVTLSWMENGSASNWVIEYGPHGFTPGSGTTAAANTNPFTIDNLASAVTYDFYVKADCGGGDESPLTGPVAATPGSYNMPATGTNTITTCSMIIYDDGGIDNDYSMNCNSTLIIQPATAGNAVAIQGTATIEASWEYLRIYDGAGTSGTMLGEYSGQGITIPLLTSTTGPLTVTFTSDASVAYSGFELTVSCISNTCPPPSSITVSNVGNTSATVSWTPTGTETSWIVEHKESSASTWTVATATTTSYQLTGLTGLTTYDVRVKADCGDETSAYKTTSFTTPNCAATDACEYTFILGDGYGDGWNSGYLTLQQGGVTIATLEAEEHGGGNEQSYDTVHLVLCDNTATSLVWSSGSYDDEVSFTILGPDGTQIYTYSDMSSYTTYTFTTDCSNTPPGPDPCATPTGLHSTDVQNESIAVAWDANSAVTNWNIQYRVVNGQWSSATSNTNSYNITGLTGNTDYQIQVQANCGDGNLSEWSSMITVHTTNVGIMNHLESSVVLFPNPAKEYIDVRIDGDVTVSAMEVYDVYGKLINTIVVTENPTRINVSNLANGMYFVRVTTEEGMVTKTFVKK
jgi:hypothetical protein